MSRKSIWIVTLLAMAVAIAALITGCGSVPENAAATVNGKIITKDDVAQRIRVAIGINPTKVPSDPESEDYKNFQRDITEQIVAEEVESQEVQKRGVTVSADEVGAVIDQIVEDKYFGSVQKMQDDFSKRGLTEDDLRNEVLRRLLHQKLLESLRAEVPVNEEDIQAQYQKNIGSYVYPEKRQVRQVVAADEATARSFASRIAAGEDMANIAQQSSTDTKTKSTGGLLGLVTQAQLPKTVGDVAFSLPLNQPSMPFKGEQGWYIVRVELITPASNRTYDMVKDDLIKFASNQKLAERYKTYVEEIKGAYDIEYADDYSPRDKSQTETEPGPVDTTAQPDLS